MRRAGERAWSTTALVLTASLALGCRSADDGTFEGDVPDPSSTTTTDASTTTSTTQAPACKEVFEPAGPPVVADLDGDGVDDRVLLVVPDAGDEGAPAQLVVTLGGGGGASATVEVDPVAPPALVGAAPVEEGGPDAVWLRVGAGASTTILGLYHLDGCSLEAATFESGDPVQLPIGGTVGTASGAACAAGADREADLLVYESTLIEGDEYEVVTTEYRWEDGTLVVSPQGAPTVARSDDIAAFTGFRCGDLAL